MEATERSEGNEKSASMWTARTEQLLQDWRNRVYAAQSAYYLMADRHRRWNYLLGVPVVVVSTLVGTAIFTELEKLPQFGMYGRVVVGSVSLLAAVLASLQTFLRFAESATLHGAAADWYAAIRRDIEELLALPPELRGGPKERLASIRREMNKAGQKSPELSERLWARVARRFGVKEPPLTGGGLAE